MLILTILKWIGIIILILIAAIIITVAYLLLIPFSYGVNAQFTDKSFFLTICDPLRLYKIKISLKNKKPEIHIAFLFNLISKKKKKNAKKNREDKKNIKKDKEKKKENKSKTEKKRSLKERITESVSFISKEENRTTIRFIIKEIIGLIKKLSPKSIMANIDFAATGPDITGYIVAGMSVIPFLYQKNVSIIPDFTADSPYIEGRLRVRGGFSLIHILITLGKLYMNPGVRKILQKIR